MKDAIRELLNSLPNFESLEAFEFVTGKIPVYSYESRVQAANNLHEFCKTKNVSMKDAWVRVFSNEYP